jgi:glutamine amidotransferase PdxT
MQKMLDAQLVGIQAIQSDLARHSSVLNQLRTQLQTVRSLQAGAKPGGVRVERLGGESTLVNRAAEARELEAKIKAEEPLVAQFSKALQDAQQQYAALQHSMNQLLVE